MALEWKVLPFQALQKAVLLVSLFMLVYQDYLSLEEYQKHEYIQVPEETTLAKVTLPMIVVCNEEAFLSNETSKADLFTGASMNIKFLGWSKENLTTIQYLKSLLVENQLNMSAVFSHRIVPTGKEEPLKIHPLRITAYEGQCYSIKVHNDTLDHNLE